MVLEEDVLSVWSAQCSTTRLISLLVCAEEDGRVVTPEAERVTKRHIDIHRLLRRAHDDPHVNFVLWVLHVYGGVQVACPRQNRQASVSPKWIMR